jgi:hypothetical protein
MIQQKPTFDLVSQSKPGNGVELALYKKKLALSRNLLRAKGLTDCRMPSDNFDKLRLALSERSTSKVHKNG